MKFCKACGQALNLFETHDEDVCYSCLKKEIKQEKPALVVKEERKDTPLGEMFLSREDGKFVLRSSEGWVLWSGPDAETYRMEDILSRARKICEIRNKRKK